MTKPIVHYKRVKRPAQAGDYIKANKSSYLVHAGKYYLVSETEYIINGNNLVLNKGTNSIVSLYNGSRTENTVKVYERIVK